MTRAVTILVLLAAAPTPAFAESVVVVAQVDGGRARSGPVQAKLGQTVELEVRRGRGRRSRALPEGATVRWLRVEPRMTPSEPNERANGHHFYSNSRMFGEDHGRWIGFDAIEYDTVALETGPGVTTIDGARLRMSRAHPSRHDGLGTAWIAAEVTTAEGEMMRTADHESVDRLGLLRGVMRVSFRSDDSFLGWLASYFGVPYVFGSTGVQTDRYIATDCADAMVGARRAMGHKGTPYTSVVGLRRVARPRTGVHRLGADGSISGGDAGEARLRWGQEAREGDLLAMDFIDDPRGVLPRAWDHVAVLMGDSSDGVAGELDPSDPVRHMTTKGLRDEPLREMGEIRFRLFRWRR